MFLRKKPTKNDRAPWVLRAPAIFQINSSLIFIGVMLSILGLLALLGISDPQAITSQMSLPFYKLWGLCLFLGGGFLSYGIVVRDELIEKYSARAMSFGLVAWSCWALVAVGLSRGAGTLVMTSIIIFFLEQRISLINVLVFARRIAARHEEKINESSGGDE